MKILIYSDLHCSYNSSILPLYTDYDTYPKFTTRLNMILRTGKWLSGLAAEQDVDLIINGGDTFNNITVRTEELEAIYIFFSCFKDLKQKHYVVVGNHEKVNENFNASTILKGYENIYVIDKPTRINDIVSVLPYMESSEVNDEVLKPIKNQLLVSHIDIQGSCLRDSYILDSGVLPEFLAEYFDFVCNGHLHTAETLLSRNGKCVCNVGSVSSISFVDNQEYIPSAVIYDSDTNTFTRYENPHAILFRRCTVDTIKDLMTYISKLDPDHKYVLMVKYTNYDQKLDLQKVLDQSSIVIAYKLVNVYSAETVEGVVTDVADVSSLNIKEKFSEFLDTVELKYEKKDYLDLLERCEVNG